ncbi:hypothetical protein CC2G_010449 [Coprinopsis cinerea AmutBmut pab1-1]|nr:hypothetical protein CC2G_010449 [Coprinopsis cinerea AmutBmut pab1-1]
MIGPPSLPAILHQYYDAARQTTHVLVYGKPEHSPLTFLLLWSLRIVTVSILLRTFVGPWVLRLIYSRIRIRSVSPRSIRGVFLRSGERTIRIERIGWGWSNLTLDGFTLDVGDKEVPKASHPPEKTSSNFAFLNPKPLLAIPRAIYNVISLLLEPWLKPIFRHYTVMALQFILTRVVPAITQRLSFVMRDTTLTFSALPGTKIVVKEVTLTAAVQFLQTENGDDGAEPVPPREAQTQSEVATWGTRLRDGFRRSLDRAWGSTQGKGSVTFKASRIEGTMPQSIRGYKVDRTFLSIPNSIELRAGMDFNPRTGAIEPHTLDISLSMDTMVGEVDLLNLLLTKLKPPSVRTSSTDKRNVTVPPLDIPSPRSSVFFPSAGLPSALQSAMPSFASSFFPPSAKFGPLSALSPKTGGLLSPRSLRSPASPFFRALSSSVMRPRRHNYIRPSTKLKDEPTISSLAVLGKVMCRIDCIKLSASPSSPFKLYSASFKSFDLIFGLAETARNAFHHQWLGKRMPTEKFDPDTYALSLSFKKIKAVKQGGGLGSFPLVAIGPITCNAVAQQWPAPFLVTSPLMRGDPNSPFVGLSFEVAYLEAKQTLVELRELLNALPMRKPTPTAEVQALGNDVPTPTPLALPRIVFHFGCGPMLARLLFTANTGQGQEWRALEAKTDGFVINLQSVYRLASTSTKKMFPAFTSVLPVEMDAGFSVYVKPASVRTSSIAIDQDEQLDAEAPSVFSSGEVEFAGTVRAVAETDGPGEGIAVLDKASISCDGHLRVESVCVELWSPVVVDSVHQFLSLIPPPPIIAEEDFPPTSQPPPRFRKPPIGLAFTATLNQCVAFVTAPDINPNDTYELSRGLSFRTAVGLEACSILPSHIHWYHNEVKIDHRAKLLLPLDSVLQNVMAGGKNVTSAPQRSSAFFKVHFRSSAIRSLVATQFAPSEPLIIESLDIPPLPQDFVRINHVHVEACITVDHDPEGRDTCNISVQAPSVRADFKLSHVYSVLLAVQTLASLQARRTSRSAAAKAKSSLEVHLEATITNFQVYWTLPQRNVVTRFDGLSARLAPSLPPQVGFSQAALFVPLPSRVDRWESETPGRWGELLNLQKWDATIILDNPDPSISVTGQSGCLRIPSGFVFFDLVFDISILAKALKHITHITKAGRFWNFPSPAPEGPKIVPHLSFRIGYLCLEAEDDPFECKLGRIFQAGLDGAKSRMDREAAFTAKVAAILEQQGATIPHGSDQYQFDPRHAVSIEEARQRLDKVHIIDWKMRIDRLSNIRTKAEEANLYRLFGSNRPALDEIAPNLVPVIDRQKDTSPLIRMALHNLNLIVGGPSFPLEELPTFLNTQGSGMPTDTQYSLLIPLHIHFTLTAFKITLRDYPIPLFNILPQLDKPENTVFAFDTDLVIAEEMGTDLSTEWFQCAIIDAESALDNEVPWSITVPKTIMPVKTYANPIISVKSSHPTVLAWGVSYGPAMQDVMRVIETLTSPPQDPSPVMGFWDKLRLIMHWKVDFQFEGDLHVYLKGLRSPYDTYGHGAGFVLAFQGSPRIKIGYENEQKELIQITSDLMSMAVPDLDNIAPNSLFTHVARTLGVPRPFKKTWARLNSGVRFGIGFLPERSCGVECLKCHGLPVERQCRLFTFKPHYQVTLEKKPIKPEIKTDGDTYNGFRSDFVHLSFSLESSLNKSTVKARGPRDYSSLHFTPQLFAHFWAWCTLFGGPSGLPIRQGNYYPPKPVSPKLGRHMATLKYRISIPHLYVMHGYMDESPETWADGVDSWIGVKAMVDEFHVDMHQREEESIVPGPIPGTTRILRRKPFNAAEVVLKGLDMRALVAVFDDPLKKSVPSSAAPHRSNYRKHADLPLTNPSSSWHDINDFIELDWRPQENPLLHLMPVVTCPRFSYFKRISATDNRSVVQKFGTEDSHVCLLDKEPSAPRVQILLASARAAELRRLIRKASTHAASGMAFDHQTAEKMVSLLEDYVTLLQDLDAKLEPSPTDENYHLPAEIISKEEYAEFENVYHVHCPSIFLDAAIRDIMMQYYYCSRARKGLEYHMATRAVKFIRDQANAAISNPDPSEATSSPQAETVNIATAALRKVLGNKTSIEISRVPESQSLDVTDPLDGWVEGVSLRKSHCCLLMKPQIVLRGTESKDTCIVAASQAKLQSFAIMDILNSDDPVSGKIMSRNYTSLTGMQVFSPTTPLALGNTSIPLEVLIDMRCESTQFERLVPQTDAVFHYDKFNRLRLRNKATTALARPATDESGTSSSNHLQDQTDLLRVHIPRFTVSATTEHFQAISNVVTKLLLFSDAAHKTRLDRLETMIFTYDFRDLHSASNVISNLQKRLRDVVETQETTARNAGIQMRRLDNELERENKLRIRFHILSLQEELGLLFDAIKLAQDRFDASAEQNNALLLHASSIEISWRMLDERRNLLAKLVVQDINFHWLNRQDSSTVNHLTVGNLTAFDGSRYAMWAEIISKYDEPANHPLLKVTSYYP